MGQEGPLHDPKNQERVARGLTTRVACAALQIPPLVACAAPCPLTSPLTTSPPTHPPRLLAVFAATLVWQAFMPVSLAACVLAPLYYSWVLWDNWWVSPIFLATLLTAPMKWVPWAEVCLLWPGII